MIIDDNTVLEKTIQIQSCVIAGLSIKAILHKETPCRDRSGTRAEFPFFTAKISTAAKTYEAGSVHRAVQCQFLNTQCPENAYEKYIQQVRGEFKNRAA